MGGFFLRKSHLSPPQKVYVYPETALICSAERESSIRVLHVVKTADGADWAAEQASELVRHGVDVHVVVPSLQGRTILKWREAGATLHVCPADITAAAIWSIPAASRKLRELIARIKPDLIHSHFVSSTILLRLSLGADSVIPRLFQVPGPLHLEHPFWRSLEISTAAQCDSWIASSRCILSHYRAAGIAPERLYLSYYGANVKSGNINRAGTLRERFGIGNQVKIVGNANFIYPPKWHLGQRRGLKAHEDVIDALGLVLRQRQDVMGVLLGGSFKHSHAYECSLRKRAEKAAGHRILMPGYLPMEEIRRMWPDFDLAVHVPTSENCGGIIEPMLAGVPVIAGRVGGLPEVAIDGLTGTTVPVRQPGLLAQEILNALDDHDRRHRLAKNAQTLVREMFDVERTAQEVLNIYEYSLRRRAEPPAQFAPRSFLAAKAVAQDQHPERLDHVRS